MSAGFWILLKLIDVRDGVPRIETPADRQSGLTGLVGRSKQCHVSL